RLEVSQRDAAASFSAQHDACAAESHVEQASCAPDRRNVVTGDEDAHVAVAGRETGGVRASASAIDDGEVRAPARGAKQAVELADVRLGAGPRRMERSRFARMR